LPTTPRRPPAPVRLIFPANIRNCHTYLQPGMCLTAGRGSRWSQGAGDAARDGSQRGAASCPSAEHGEARGRRVRGCIETYVSVNASGTCSLLACGLPALVPFPVCTAGAPAISMHLRCLPMAPSGQTKGTQDGIPCCPTRLEILQSIRQEHALLALPVILLVSCWREEEMALALQVSNGLMHCRAPSSSLLSPPALTSRQAGVQAVVVSNISPCLAFWVKELRTSRNMCAAVDAGWGGGLHCQASQAPGVRCPTAGSRSSEPVQYGAGRAV
jgi:hypothetical protein